MSDKFQPISMDQLASWIFKELEAKGSIFGLPKELFFTPAHSDRFRADIYGQVLETPFGVAAGPHTQMAQNLIFSWLCGARFMELKTVQTLDELEVSKPCIDMQDEGYNVEWSQELKIQQSFEEYLRAWVLIYALHNKLGFPGESPGVIFNMSVGYNLEGIQKDNVQWFLAQMNDAGPALDEHIKTVAKYCPEIKDIYIPKKVSDNVTVSTMHGCPPEEIGRICHYLMEDKKLHTNVKLNPTLLGPEELRSVLNRELGYEEIVVPDEAFGHDLKYPDAIDLLTDLQAAAPKCGVLFGVKLCNTLEVQNHREAFDPKETMMYMSGRPHHVLAINVARKLSEAFDGKLAMSFAGGVDAFNAADLLRCGMKTITTCSDILRTGGYTRMLQYVENTAAAMEEAGAEDLDEFICKTVADGVEVGGSEECALENLKTYAASVRKSPLYMKERFDRARTKTDRELGLFDCIMAPCADECPISQKVPEYMRLVAAGRFDEAINVTRDDNPMPTVLGRACNHKCENVCVRTQYDDPLAIREMKRFIMDQEKSPHHRLKQDEKDVSVAVIGGGPCGLAVAYFLAQAGISVTIFEQRAYTGGMVSGSIPGYRATQASIDQDMEILKGLGVDIRYDQQAGRDFRLDSLKDDFKYTVIAAGAQKGMRLGVEGEDAEGVLDGLAFLRAAREGKAPKLGKRVGVIGGGDVAMDCARTANRLTEGEVRIIYRRTMAQMPAQREELDGLLEEHIAIKELAAPRKVIIKGGKLSALECSQMELGEPDESGRRRPVEVPGAEFKVPLDHLIVAIGQQPALQFIEDSGIETNRKGYIMVDEDTMRTSVENIYAGGDVVLNGPETIVKAFGDGKKIAADIFSREGGDLTTTMGTFIPDDTTVEELSIVDLLRRRSRREFRVTVPHVAAERRDNFEEVVKTLSEEDAVREAKRCLACDRLCSICVSVCPNRAFMTYKSRPMDIVLPELTMKNGKLVSSPGKKTKIDQRFQVAVLTDFCNECGNCATFCPTSGKPYQDKPRIYLNHAEFEAQADNAFMIMHTDDGWKIEAKFDGSLHALTLGKRETYTSPKIRAVIDTAACEIKEAEPNKGVAEGEVFALEHCAVMHFLLANLIESMPQLPFPHEREVPSHA